MQDNWLTWRHAFKLDPDRKLDDQALERLCLSGSDGIIVGGSSGVTYENTVDLLARIRRYAISCVLEVSNLEAVVPGFDGYLIPIVLNTHNAEWIIGQHRQAIQRYSAVMPWAEMTPEGYLILNPESTAAKLTEAYLPTEEELMATAELADKLLRLPVIYVEYSGIYGDMDIVQRIRSRLKQARLVYGGGIDSAARAAAAREAADLIVVGNVVYTDLEAALATV